MSKEPMENLDYLELIRQAALRTSMPEAAVRLILEGLLDVMKEALGNQKRVILREFGTIRTQVREHSRLGDHAVVVFRASNALQEHLTRELIDGNQRRRNGEVRRQAGPRGEGEGL